MLPEAKLLIENYLMLLTLVHRDPSKVLGDSELEAWLSELMPVPQLPAPLGTLGGREPNSVS